MDDRVMIDLLYGSTELKQEFRPAGKNGAGSWYGWSITRDREGREVSRTAPREICRLSYPE